jgi:hypothetical protein
MLLVVLLCLFAALDYLLRLTAALGLFEPVIAAHKRHYTTDWKTLHAAARVCSRVGRGLRLA